MKVSARVGPLVLAVVGLVLAVGFGRAWRGDLAGATAPWWAYLFLMLLAIAMLALAAAVSIDPRPLQLRQSLAGAALVWLGVLIVLAIGAAGASRATREEWLFVVLAVVVASALGDLVVTTPGGRRAGRRYRSVPAPRRGRRLRRGDLHGDWRSGHRRQPRARHLAVHRPRRAGRPAAVGSRRGHRDPAASSRSRSPRSAAVARRVGRSRSRRPRTGGTASCSSSPWSGSWPRPRR